MIQPQGRDDLILDGIVSKLSTWRDVQVAEALLLPAPKPDVNFLVSRDRESPWKEVAGATGTLSVPLVNLSLAEESRSEKGGKSNIHYTPKYHATCWVPTLGRNEAGKARIYYLKEQVRAALLHFGNYDFGQTVGVLGGIQLGPWSWIEFEDKEMEANIFAGAWGLSLDYEWNPPNSAAPALTDIIIAAGRWGGAYHFT